MSDRGMRIDPAVAAIVDRHTRDAALLRLEGRFVLRMTREFPHDVERVWSRLVDPEELARWSPIVPDRRLDSVGPARCRETPDAPPVDAEVLSCDPPRELCHRWGGNVLRWRLAPTRAGCRLTLEQTFADRDFGPMSAAGWHLCLAVLEAVLAGADVERVVGRRALDYGWEELVAQYDARFSERTW